MNVRTIGVIGSGTIDVDEQEPHWSFISAVMQSDAELVVFPVQDVLGLGNIGGGDRGCRQCGRRRQ